MSACATHAAAIDPNRFPQKFAYYILCFFPSFATMGCGPVIANDGRW
jgi:hypothetical protein